MMMWHDEVEDHSHFPTGGAPATSGLVLNATTVEVNLGSTLAWQGKFTITDASISPTSNVIVWQAPGPYTGKGTRKDEPALAPIAITHVEPGNGSAVVHWRSVESHNPIIQMPQDMRFLAERVTTPTRVDTFAAAGEVQGVSVRGKVRGNVKFLYTIAGAAAAVSPGAAWTQVISEDGSSFTNFTGDSGTWASASSVIKQTDTSAVMHRAHYNTMVVQSMLIFEAEIQIKTVSNDKIGGLLIGYDGGNGTGSYEVRLNESVAGNAGAIQTEDSGVGPFTTINTTIDIDVWYKLRLVFAGDTVSIYLDGVLKGFSRGNQGGAAGAQAPSEIDGHYVGLMSYGAETWFRNIKAWTPTLPA
jgi:hypothetical protein